MEHQELAEKYLKHLVINGAYDRYGETIPQDVLDRINIEYDVIIPNKFTDYILMIWDIHDFCRNPHRVFKFCEMKGIVPPDDGVIPIGPGRGSVGGSMVCYCIGITQCDPLLFGLFFERFLNPERIAYPDIDFDISKKYRHIGIAYIADVYGEEYVSQIITYGTLSKNNVVHDVLQSYGIPNSMINEVKKAIPDDPSIDLHDILNTDNKFITALQSIDFPDMEYTIDANNAPKILNNTSISEDIRSKAMNVLLGTSKYENVLVKSKMEWQKALEVMLRLEGLEKNESKHAAGVVVAPVRLDGNVPLMKRKGEGSVVCQYDMKSLEAIGYLKMDALGLRTVDVNYDAEQLIRKWYDKNFSFNNLKYDDVDSVKLINNGDTIGIFQIEGTGFTQMMQDLDIAGYEVQRFTDRNDDVLTEIEKLRGLEIKDFMWISAGLALYRPGPLDAVIEGKTMVKHLCDRKSGNEPITYLFSEEKQYLEETYGVLVYQEQVMSRVRQMTGCSYGRADILRKAMGKKDDILMKEQMDWLKNAAMDHTFSNDNVFNDVEHKKRIVYRACEEIEKFARYGFNKAHTVEYAHICYYNAYAKSHHPDCFYTALLNSLTDKPDNQTVIIRDMLNHNVELLPPDINESDTDFVMTDHNVIRFGLGAIKQFGEKALNEVLRDKEERGEYKSIEEFRIRVSSKLLNKTVIVNLAKCGAFDALMKNDNSTAEFENRASLVESMPALCDTIGKLKRKKPKDDAPPSVDEVLKKWNKGAGTYKITQVEDDSIQYAIWEKEILKYYISAHPIDAYADEMNRWGAIQNCDDDMLPDEFYIAGFVEGCHETVIKKEGRNKGKKMGFIMIGTAFRMYEGTMFPGIYESCLPYIKAGNPVIMKGKKNVYNGKTSVQVEYIRSMINDGIRDCPECHIRFNNKNDIINMMMLHDEFKKYFGSTTVFIHIQDGYNDYCIKSSITISLNDYLINLINKFGTIAYKDIV